MAEGELVDPLDPNADDTLHKELRAIHKEAENEAYNTLRVRQESYRRVFNGNAMEGDLERVMDDLRKFCRGGQTPWHSDPRVHALLTGRFEVWTRIEQHTHMSLDDLWTIYSGDKS